MGLKSDNWIQKQVIKYNMIEPFINDQISVNTISYGLSSYGYDIRIADEYKVFTNVNSTMISPKKFDSRSITFHKGGKCIIPPNSFILARSVEYFKMPRDVLAICLGKSTYARCGIIVNVTPFEPEFEGYITMEISNTTQIPAEVYSDEGIAQILFIQGDEICKTSYWDKNGKYQRQAGITIAK